MSRPADRPRRLLTDWTTTAGLAGDGLLALVVGEGSTPEAIHLATLGYEVFVLAGGEDLTHVHHVEVAADALPDVWRGRFALVVTFEPEATAHLVPVLAEGGVLTVVGDDVPTVDGVVEVQRETGEDPDEPGVVRTRLVAARL